VRKAKTPEEISACHDPKNLIDAFVALDMKSGEIKWATKLSASDSWTVSCKPGVPVVNPKNCPDPAGPDYGKLYIYQTFFFFNLIIIY
jgi:polyvinyl alcohol dehydrogenase (cytochrome)